MSPRLSDILLKGTDTYLVHHVCELQARMKCGARSRSTSLPFPLPSFLPHSLGFLCPLDTGLNSPTALTETTRLPRAHLGLSLPQISLYMIQHSPWFYPIYNLIAMLVVTLTFIVMDPLDAGLNSTPA
jgi:hypothetical protein